jgi:mannose-6-phosphate isomerase-like protein (cupin superfamily)
MAAQDAVSVIRRADWGAPLSIVTGGAVCRPAIWPGMGARERSLHHFAMPAGSGTVRLAHPSEAVYYVMSGEVLVTDHSEASDPRRLGPGAMFHVAPGTSYSMISAEDATEVIGGPCPADDALYAVSGGETV